MATDGEKQDWKRIPIDEIFSQNDQLSPTNDPKSPLKVHVENRENFTTVHYTKKRQAPQPPAADSRAGKRPAPQPPGQMHLPKIGNYQPKILIASHAPGETPKNQKMEQSDMSSNKLIQNRIFEKKSEKTNYVVMGDKDVPMVIPDNDDTQSEVHVRRYHRRNSPPASPTESVARSTSGERVTTVNPLFNESRAGAVEGPTPIPPPRRFRRRNSPQPSRRNNIGNGHVIHPPADHSHFEVGHDVTKEHVTTHNPLYSENGPVSPEVGYEESQEAIFDFSSTSTNHVYANETNTLDRQQRSNSSHEQGGSVYSEITGYSRSDITNEDDDMPYIPEPDYDIDEVTVDFSEETERLNEANLRQGQKVFKEFEGEDFGKYLSDEEDYEFDKPHTARKNIRYKRAQPNQNNKQNKKPQPKKDTRSNYEKAKPKSSGASKNVAPQSGRHTIRDFAYSDSKIGYDDRTVKSTSAKGRYVKRSKERSRVDDRPFSDDGMGSYEAFLKTRQTDNGSLESNSSGDSGHETGDDIRRENIFYHSQPRQFRKHSESSYKDGKSSIWQKLTWRFRRHVGLYNTTDR